MSERTMHRFSIRNCFLRRCSILTRFITVKRKYILYGGLMVLVAFASIFGANLFRSSQVSSTPTQVDPELKILSIEFEPQITIRDISYAGEVFKGLQTINKDSFKISAVIQNMTDKIVTDVPVKLIVSAIEDKSKSMSKEGKIPTLEPGATAKIAFEKISALGDAQGQSPTAGQHEMVLAISANPAGGISQNTEARIIFNVDTSVK